jgi:hypothetical protein
MYRLRGGEEKTINIDKGNGDDGTYTGNLKGNKYNEKLDRHGLGKMKYNNGNVYNGHFYYDKMNGEGEMKYKNGDVYDGRWDKSKKNGEGKMKYKDGGFYHGLWFMDERGIGKTNKKEASESYKTAIDYNYYTIQKPSDLIIGKTYLLYSPKNKKREIAVFIKERVDYEKDGGDHGGRVWRYNDYIFDPKVGSKIDKIEIKGIDIFEWYPEIFEEIDEVSDESHFEHRDLKLLEFCPINQVLLFKDENPFYNRESKKIPTGPYKETLDYMYQVRGGKTNKRKKKVRGRGKKRKTQRYRTL